MRRTLLNLAVGVVAGAALVGVPAYALTDDEDGGGSGREDMGRMMSDPEVREDMKSFMVDMMNDPELRAEMRDMMSEGMGGMNEMQGMKGMEGDGMTMDGDRGE